MPTTSSSVYRLTDQVAQFHLRFPIDSDDLDQDQEWCEVRTEGEREWTRVRFHDYHEVYRVPGLYEALFYQCLKCCSPYRVVQLLDDVLRDDPRSVEDLRVLERFVQTRHAVDLVIVMKADARPFALALRAHFAPLLILIEII